MPVVQPQQGRKVGGIDSQLVVPRHWPKLQNRTCRMRPLLVRVWAKRWFSDVEWCGGGFMLGDSSERIVTCHTHIYDAVPHTEWEP